MSTINAIGNRGIAIKFCGVHLIRRFADPFCRPSESAAPNASQWIDGCRQVSKVETTRLEYKAKPTRKSTVSKSSLHFPVQFDRQAILQAIVDALPTLDDVRLQAVYRLATGDESLD
jgi:hypothetical protein